MRDLGSFWCFLGVVVGLPSLLGGAFSDVHKACNGFAFQSYIAVVGSVWGSYVRLGRFQAVGIQMATWWSMVLGRLSQ